MASPNIRNFCIIAHIDHGKTTLSDRLMEFTETVSQRELHHQMLDSMDLERERGITIKAQAVRMDYSGQDGQSYVLNLIDTPGHVDFAYEVSRSLAACEGAILVVDAAQGVQAQTLANAYLAVQHDLEIIPVINKIDLPTARIDFVRDQIRDVVGLDPDDVILASAKTGDGVTDILEAVVARIPPPGAQADAPLRALIFDSVYNQFRGVVTYVRVFDGVLEPGTRIQAMGSRGVHEVGEVGVLRPAAEPVQQLRAGEVGYVIANVKTLHEMEVGDTLTFAKNGATEPLRAYAPAKPMVFCGMYPSKSDDYPQLREAIEKLSLNDSSFTFEPETSRALGFGFRCGFLGLLHMEIAQERLEREFDLSLVITAPSVAYAIETTTGEVREIDNPAALPDPTFIKEYREPFIRAQILVPQEFVGPVLELCEGRRGTQVDMKFYDAQNGVIVYELPLAEIVTDFFDKLKSCTRGYGSLDYEFIGFRPAPLVRLDILLNGSPVDALSSIVHKERAYARGRALCTKLKRIIPRQLFEVIIQAAIGSRVIARERNSPLRKNVTAKCYGGDITRKRKLLEKQKEGKKRMKQVGNVEVPQDAFMAVFQVADS